MSFALVGQSWSPEEFRRYLRTVNLSWASGCTIHHMAAPDLSQRPRGLTAQHLENLRHYYGTELGWSAGPHLFVDDDQIWGLSLLDRPGVHARSFNRTHIGLEVLGNYDREDPTTGRGARCWETAAKAVAAILDAAGWDTNAINGHRDDPQTSKTCPGKLVDIQAFRRLVGSAKQGTDHQSADRVDPRDEEIRERLGHLQWQLDRLRELMG